MPGFEEIRADFWVETADNDGGELAEVPLVRAGLLGRQAGH